MATRVAVIVGWLLVWAFFMGWFLLAPANLPKQKDLVATIGAAIAGSAAWFALVLALSALNEFVRLWKVVVHATLPPKKSASLVSPIGNWISHHSLLFAIGCVLFGLVAARIGWS